MSEELDPYPGNLKRHVVEPAKPKLDQDAFLRNLDKAKTEPLLSDEKIRGYKGEATIVKMLNNVPLSAIQVREIYEHARTKDTALLREGEQFMQHRSGCQQVVLLGEHTLQPTHNGCTCGLSQYMEKFKDRTK